MISESVKKYADENDILIYEESNYITLYDELTEESLNCGKRDNIILNGINSLLALRGK